MQINTVELSKIVQKAQKEKTDFKNKISFIATFKFSSSAFSRDTEEYIEVLSTLRQNPDAMCKCVGLHILLMHPPLLHFVTGDTRFANMVFSY